MTVTFQDVPERRPAAVLMAITSFLSAVLLGLGTRNPGIPVVMLVVTSAAVALNDWQSWFTLNKYLAYVAMVAGTLFVISDFMSRSSLDQLVSIGNMLLVFQGLLLFQAKDVRVFRNLLILSALQVVVASLLDIGLLFGMVLVLYAMAAFGTLAVVCHCQLRNHCHPDLQRDTAFWPRFSFRFGSRAETKSEVADPAPWRIARGENRPTWSSVDAESSSPNSFAGRWRFIGGLILATLLLAGLYFYSVPRSTGGWQSFGKNTSVGFSNELRIQDLQRIQQRHDVVMRATFFDPETNEPLQLLRDPYFRGAVANYYSQVNGEASWTLNSHRIGRLLDTRPAEIPAGLNYVRQEISLPPSNLPNLFSVGPAYRLPGTTPDIRLRQSMSLLYRTDPMNQEGSATSFPSLRYTLAVTGFRTQAPRLIYPVGSPDGERPAVEFDHLERATFLQWNRLEHEPLRRLAAEILSKVSSEDRIRQAIALEDYLRNTRNYTYSLDTTMVQRDYSLDPIVDFAINHRTGSCSHFASALALMLRSQGIPCRMVIGFKGGDFNTLGNFYQVKSLHAHAWVEALLESDDYTPYDLPEVRFGAKGAWLKLDPTPSSSSISQDDQEQGVVKRVNDLLDYAQWIWSDYVVGLSSSRQRDYQPASQRALESFSKLFAPAEWRQQLRRFWEWIGLDSREGWFAWRGGLFVMVCLGLALWLGRWVRRLRFSWPGRTRRIAPRRSYPPCDFYLRFERLLAALRVVRSPSQTPREFALGAVSQLGLPPENAPETTSKMAQIVEQFYRVRYGECALDKAEIEQLEHALAWLTDIANKGTT